MENISDEFAFFKASIVVVIVGGDHLAEMVCVALNDDLAFIFFAREGEVVQSSGNCIIMSARFVYWNIIFDAPDINQELTVLSVCVEEPLDKNNIEKVCILREEMTHTVFVFVIVPRNAQAIAALKRRQLDVR